MSKFSSPYVANDEWKVRRRDKNKSSIQFAMEDPKVPPRSLSSADVGSPFQCKPQDILNTSPHPPLRKQKVNEDFARRIVEEGFPLKDKNPEYGIGTQTRTRDPAIQSANNSSIHGIGCNPLGLRKEHAEDYIGDLRWENVNDDFLGTVRPKTNGIHRPKYMPLKSAVPADSPWYDKVVDIETRRPTVLNLGVGSKRHVTPTQNAQVSQIVWGSEPQQRYKWSSPNAADGQYGDAAGGGHADPEAFNSPQHHQQQRASSASPSVRRVRKPVADAPSSNSYRVLHTSLQEEPAAFRPSLRTNIAPVPELEKTDEEKGPLKRWEFFSMRR
jgi:hypothetical protein